MDIKRLFMDICMDLWAGDCDISYDLFINALNERINNLKSHLGEANHKRLKELGVTDETGMTWEEQDVQVRRQIQEHESLLQYLEDDHNWTL